MKTFFYFVVLNILLCLNVKAQRFGNALQYDGVNDYVDMGYDSTFDVRIAVTYEAWINPDTTLNGFIFNKWADFAESKQFEFFGNRVYFYLYDVFGGTQLVSSPSIPIHEYTHVAATYDGSTAKLYINGVFDTSKAVGSGVGNSTRNLYFGFNPIRPDWSPPFKGIIDEVRIWNVARTESEIQSTMNQILNGNETGLIAYWKFDEGTGTITYDATSNHNDGTISGAIWVPSVTSVKNNSNATQLFNLFQNYPNPFNPSTSIKYTIGSYQLVTLKVYDILGRGIATLVNEYKLAGSYETEFDASKLVSGIYFYKLNTGSFTEIRKMILLR
ncbi:MAG: T9SS type A sorting domain-containing protein [Ignavibacteriae bacterium]|nr:T9SS type A sorting domain-containing protein [Ignavibacteriota bacterium]MBK8947217.1 T9SS type A sorting domain-containing protein [Ignavibacteriota bacterium]